MTKIAYLGETGAEHHALARLTSEGHCELMFQCGDEQCIFPCSLSSLINVGLGARTHFASDFGSVALVRTTGGVKIALTPWGQETELYFVPAPVFALALEDLSQVHTLREKVSLF